MRSVGEGTVGAAEGIAVDRAGRVWVSATYAGHLVVFGEDGEYLKEVGSHGAEPGELGRPEGLAVDDGGDVWVADSANARAEQFDEAGEYRFEFGSPGAGAGQLSDPNGIVVDAGRVFVGEFGNERVQEFDGEGGFIAQLGVHGAEAGDLGVPGGLASTAAGDLLIADPANNRVEKWSPEAPGAPANLAAPEISGTPGVGATLAASAGVWRGSPRRSYSYQWQRCNGSGEECSDISAATSSTYVLAGGDLTDTVRVTVTATNSDGSASRASSATEPINVPPVNITLPSISGTAQEGNELTASPGTWEGASETAYQWQRCDSLGEECRTSKRLGRRAIRRPAQTLVTRCACSRWRGTALAKRAQARPRPRRCFRRARPRAPRRPRSRELLRKAAN